MNPNEKTRIKENAMKKAIASVVAALVALTIILTANTANAADCQPNADLRRLDMMFRGMTDKASKCSFIKSKEYQDALKASKCSFKDMNDKKRSVDELCGSASTSNPSASNAPSADQMLYKKYFVAYAPVPLYFLKAWPYDDKFSDYATGQNAKVKAGLQTLQGRRYRHRRYNVPKGIVGGLDPMPGAIERYLTEKRGRDKDSLFYKKAKKRLEEIRAAGNCTSAPFVPPEASRVVADLELLIPRFNRRNPTQEFRGNTLDKQASQQMLAVAKKRLARLQAESKKWTCPDPTKKGIEDFGKLVKTQVNASNSPDKADALKLIEEGEKATSLPEKLLWFSSAATLLPPKVLASSRGLCPDCPKGGDGPCPDGGGGGPLRVIGRRAWEGASRPNWLPMLTVSISSGFHGSVSTDTRDGIDYKVDKNGFSVPFVFSFDWALGITSNISWFAGVDFILGYRKTYFKDESVEEQVESSGVTVGAGVRTGFNFYDWVSVYGLARGRFVPTGVTVGGGLELTKLSVLRLAVEGGWEKVDYGIFTGAPGSSPADFTGPFVLIKTGVAIW